MGLKNNYNSNTPSFLKNNNVMPQQPFNGKNKETNNNKPKK